MGALREILARFDIEVGGADKLKSADKGIEGLTSKLKSFGGLLAGGLIVGGLKSMIDGLQEQATALRRTSQQLGIGEQDLQAWQFAAKLSGVEAEGFATSLKLLEKNSAKAAESGSQTGGVFQKLGVNLRDQAGGPMRATQDILHDTGMAIANLRDPAEQTRVALEVFGRQGASLLPLFKKGEAGLKDALSQVEKLGGGLGSDAIDTLVEMRHAQEKWDMSLTSVKSQLVVAFLPALTSFITKATEGAVAITKNKGAMEALKIGVLAVGATFAVAGAMAAAPWIPVVALFIGLALVIQDVIVGLNGGDSATGRLLDKVFGKGTGKSVFDDLRKGIKAYEDDVRSAERSNNKFLEGFYIFESVPTIIFHALQAAGDKVRFAMQSITDAIKDSGAKIPGDLAQLLTDGITGSAKDILADAEKLGKDIVDGIVQGIKNNGEGIAESLTGVVGLGIKAVRKDQGAHSPATKPRDLVGVPIGQGITLGLLSQVPHVARAMQSLGNAAVSAPRQAIQNASSSRSVALNATTSNVYQVNGGTAASTKQGVMAAQDESMRATLAALRGYV